MGQYPPCRDVGNMRFARETVAREPILLDGWRGRSTVFGGTQRQGRRAPTARPGPSGTWSIDLLSRSVFGLPTSIAAFICLSAPLLRLF